MSGNRTKKDFRTDHLSERRRTLENRLETGILAGVVSVIPTVGLLALGGILAGVGPATPFYAIVSVLAPGALESALTSTVEGVDPVFFQRPFVGGLGICLVLGAISGVVFAIGTHRRDVHGPVRYVLGALHGVVMMCLFYLGAMRTVGVMTDLEVDAMSLSTIIGWPILIVAHVAHGVALAWLLQSRLLAPRQVFDRPGS